MANRVRVGLDGPRSRTRVDTVANMRYAANFYAYIFVADVLAVLIVVRWVKPFGFFASLAFGLVYTFLVIFFGRWLLGRKEL